MNLQHCQNVGALSDCSFAKASWLSLLELHRQSEFAKSAAFAFADSL